MTYSEWLLYYTLYITTSDYNAMCDLEADYPEYYEEYELSH